MKIDVTHTDGKEYWFYFDAELYYKCSKNDIPDIWTIFDLFSYLAEGEKKAYEALNPRKNLNPVRLRRGNYRDCVWFRGQFAPLNDSNYMIGHCIFSCSTSIVNGEYVFPAVMNQDNLVCCFNCGKKAFLHKELIKRCIKKYGFLGAIRELDEGLGNNHESISNKIINYIIYGHQRYGYDFTLSEYLFCTDKKINDAGKYLNVIPWDMRTLQSTTGGVEFREIEE